MPGTFAIPDIHGRLDLLVQALTTLDQSQPEGGTIVFLGDFVDNGPDSCAVVERLMAGSHSPKWRWILLRGNHDDLMARAVFDPTLAPLWMRKGGDRAWDSYRSGTGSEPPERLHAHAGWLGSLQLTYTDTHRLYVHGGIDPAIALDDQDNETLLNHRYRDDDGLAGYPMHLVHGHDKHTDGPLLLENRTNLDCGGWETGRLAIGAFDDNRPGGPREIIEIRADG